MFYPPLKPRKPAVTKAQTGAAMESAALEWLQAKGLTCIERNFRCRGGEIDLIMRAQQTLIFVEVRLRNHGEFGSAVESVTRAKQRRIIHAAQFYLATRASSQQTCRFDVLAAREKGNAIIWDWVQDAFYAG